MAAEQSSSEGPPNFFASAGFALLLLYLAAALVSAHQIFRIFYYKCARFLFYFNFFYQPTHASDRHNAWSLQHGFYLLCFLWGVLRVLFFSAYPLSGGVAWLYAYVFGTATIVQFATVSLLALYLARRALSPVTWNTLRVWVYGACALFNAALLVAQLSLATVVVSADDPARAEWASHSTSILFAVVFFTLVAALALLGFAVWHKSRSHAAHDAVFAHTAPSPRKIAVASATLFVCYTFRSIWDVLSAAGVVHTAIFQRNPAQQALVFFLFVVWEIVPIATVVALFGVVPATTGFKHRRPLLPHRSSTLLPPPTQQPQPPALFSLNTSAAETASPDTAVLTYAVHVQQKQQQHPQQPQLPPRLPPRQHQQQQRMQSPAPDDVFFPRAPSSSPHVQHDDAMDTS